MVTVNNAAVNVGVQIPFQVRVFVFLRKISRSQIAASHGSSMLNFWRDLRPFSVVAAPIYIPTNSLPGFPFIHILTSIHDFVFLIIAILTGMKDRAAWYAAVHRVSKSGTGLSD